MYRLRSQGMIALDVAVLVLLTCGAVLPSLATAQPTMQDLCGACTVEVFVTGGKFLEGPAVDQEGNLWVVSINSGAVSKITPNGKWTDVFNTGGQPQGLKFHKDGRLFGVDRKKGVFIYDVKAQKLSDYALYFQNQNFLGPNDLIFDRQGGLYFTDPWGTSLANLRGAVYYVSPEGKTSRLIDNMAFPNGITISADEKTLYVAETSRSAVWAVGLEESGVITQRRARILAYLPGGGAGPDGMAVDAQGNLYVAYFDAGEVVVFTGKGKRIGAITLPAGAGTFTTNVAFGGPDYKTLYITEADKNVIYKVAMQVRGLKLFGDKE